MSGYRARIRKYGEIGGGILDHLRCVAAEQIPWGYVLYYDTECDGIA